jgi:hypothetical protein
MSRLEDCFVEAHGCRVAAGPFAGMSYVKGAVCSAYLPKVIGSYEEEIQSSIMEAIAAGYQNIIDVGCAEGYYAVGLAVRTPGAKVYAFDSDPTARALCEELARANGVSERVTILGACDAASLASVPLAGSLLICDCEGYEFELLRPDLIPALRECDLIVELHDFVDSRITSEITRRFAETHEISMVASRERDPTRYSAANCLPTRYRALAVNELRHQPVTFAHLRRKRAAG